MTMKDQSFCNISLYGCDTAVITQAIPCHTHIYELLRILLPNITLHATAHSMRSLNPRQRPAGSVNTPQPYFQFFPLPPSLHPRLTILSLTWRVRDADLTPPSCNCMASGWLLWRAPFGPTEIVPYLFLGASPPPLRAVNVLSPHGQC